MYPQASSVRFRIIAARPIWKIPRARYRCIGSRKQPMHAVAKKNETLPRELHTDIPTTWYFKIPFRSLSQCERQLWLRLLLERQKNILERQVSNPFICSGTIRANSKWGLSPDVCKIFACCSYLDALSDVFCSSLAVIIVSLRVLQWRRRVTQSYRCALTGDVIGAIPMPRVHIVTEAQPL